MPVENFLAVAGRGDPFLRLEHLGKDQRIRVAAGQGDALYGQVCHGEKLRRLGDAVICQIVLGRHAEVRLKERVKVAAVDADVAGDIRHMDREGVIVLDKFHGLEDIRILPVLQNGRVDVDIPGQYGKKFIQKPLEEKTVCSCGNVVFQHIKDNPAKLVFVSARKNRMLVVKPHIA